MSNKKIQQPKKKKKGNENGNKLITCKWLLTSSLVKSATCINSLICFGVASANFWRMIELRFFLNNFNGRNKDSYYFKRESKKARKKKWRDIYNLSTLCSSQLFESIHESSVQIWRPTSPLFLWLLLCWVFYKTGLGNGTAPMITVPATSHRRR